MVFTPEPLKADGILPSPHRGSVDIQLCEHSNSRTRRYRTLIQKLSIHGKVGISVTLNNILDVYLLSDMKILSRSLLTVCSKYCCLLAFGELG